MIGSLVYQDYVNLIKAKQIIAGESQELIDLRDPKD